MQYNIDKCIVKKDYVRMLDWRGIYCKKTCSIQSVLVSALFGKLLMLIIIIMLFTFKCKLSKIIKV